jgi:LysR family transcriptional regulator for bpeEF and oprC
MEPIMDKLRALQYLSAAAQEGSFSGAARRLDVSIPAIARLVTVLESDLGVRLFDRTVNGVTLTTDGRRYLAACQPAMRQLAQADAFLSGAENRPQGTLVLGAPSFLVQHCLLPALSDFHLRYPAIQIDIRVVDRVSAEAAKEAEILLLYGWQEHPDMVHRRIAQTRSLICAAPAYWAAHGVPQRPKDLEKHTCLLLRDQEGTILDLWEYERDGDKEVVAVDGWMISSHRDVLLDAAIAGAGVARFSDLSVRAHLRSGQLVPVLLDWETKHAPPINLLYRSSQKRTPRVKLFVQFAVDLFRKLEAEREPAYVSQIAAERPQWYRRRHERASTYRQNKS